MYRLIFTAVLLMLLINNTAIGNQIAIAPAAAEDADAKKAKQVESVYQELAKMVPGDVEAGSDIENAIKETIRLFADRKPIEAQQSLQDLADGDANFPPAELMLAALAYAVNDMTSGKALLEQAAINNENYPDVHFSFAQLALTQRRWADAEAQAEFGLKKTTGGSFTQLQTDHFMQRYQAVKFQLAKSRGQWEKAKAALQQLESLAPEATQTLAGKAEVAFQDKDINKAIGFLKQLNSITTGKPRIPELTIANWFQRKGKVQNAELWIRKAVAENSANADVQRASAQWFLNRENFPETLKAIQALESISGQTNLSQEIRGKVAFAQGAYATAEKEFESLLAKDSKNIDHANMLALSMVQSPDEEKQKKAVGLARQVASAQSNNAVALSSLAYVMLKSGQSDGARSILAKVAQMPNSNAEVSFIVAYMLSETGQSPQAKTILENVVNTRGLFLFRNQAKRLLTSLQQSSQALPEPRE